MKFSTTEDVAVPAETVFDAFCAFETFERAAMRRGAEVQRVDSRTVPGVGMIWVAGFQMRGKPRQLRIEMVEFDHPHEMALDTTSPGFQGMTRIEVISLARERTRLHISLEIKPQTLPARVMVQSLRLAKASLTRKFKLRVAEYAQGIEARHRNDSASGRWPGLP